MHIIDNENFEDILIQKDKDTNITSIIALHNTRLGPALGGCRFISYKNFNAALHDALSLAKGMSYKSALAGLPLGGGKAVIMKPQQKFAEDKYFQGFGKFIDSLNGKYITALDSGTTLNNMDTIAQSTKFVASGSAKNGNSAPATIAGILAGMRAAILHKFGKNSFNNLHIAIQGLGQVGFGLAKELKNQGAKITASDLNHSLCAKAVTELGVNIVDIDDIHKIPCDIFSPCALGQIITTESVHEIQAKIIAGGANNQLADPELGNILLNQNIMYVPDYVINAGGVIFAYGLYAGVDPQDTNDKITNIQDTTMKILDMATSQNLAPHVVADKLAEEVLC
jgi:leucine dehydrogenase